jgi:hypothetical protein
VVVEKAFWEREPLPKSIEIKNHIQNHKKTHSNPEKTPKKNPTHKRSIFKTIKT